jgi:hypothetical protein
MLKSLAEISMPRELVCHSCGQQKMTLRKIKSSLIPDMELVMCATCISNKYEPRYVIILAARTVNIKDVKKFIVERRYLGEEIPASDIL